MHKKKASKSSQSNASARAAAKPSSGAAPETQPGSRTFPVVGIGASAGGLEAMTQLLKHLPARTGMAFVLVQHLDPKHESALTTLLARLTEMPVNEARNNLRLRPDNIYVIPPNKSMGVSGRRLKLSPRNDTETHLLIDEFFRTLAEEEGNRAIGVILSGNGSDGTQGLLAIKTAGGITFAQEEKSAKYPAMPGSAITAGCVDFVLPPERIARELARLAGHPYVTPGGVEEQPPEGQPPAKEKAFESILQILRQRMAVDFTHYKHATLQRRIQRRMVLHKTESLKAYADYLRANATEVAELFSDILIHVTGFFRDPAVFLALKKKLFPRMVKSKPADEPIRIWVPGCSTGEEVFSIAIVLMEFMADRNLHHTAQIFGTDIHERALEKARAGWYPETIKTDVSDERLRRFFVRVDGGYRINKAIREMCIFARQNVVADPPFSNLDLISCRNLLIYLGQGLQRKAIPLFHYALKPNGFLMLGASETIGGFSDLFALQDNKAKIYAKKTTQVRPPVSFGHPGPDPGVAATPPTPPLPIGAGLAEVQRQADRILLTQYGPAGVVINSHLDVLQFRGQTGSFLEHPHGDASLNVLKMAREGLMLDLRTAINKAFKQNARVRQSGVHVRQNESWQEVTIEIVPYTVPPSAEKFYLVLFQTLPSTEVWPGKKLPRHSVPGRKSSDSNEMTRLREELAATRESLQGVIEEQEGTNEELRSANEEILSSNEELQSTNEELETAKEELQSTNEELTTLNDELESRNTELEHVNNDLHNVLGSANIPIIILGPDLRIRRFTAVAEKLFNLIPTDTGRPITDINLPLNISNLSNLVLEVIENLTPREIEVKDRRDHWWSVRVRPYKTTDNKIEGAIIALVDIDLIKISAQQINQGRAFAEAVINTVPRPVLVLDKDLNVQAANQSFYRAFHVVSEETLNRRVYQLGQGQWDIPKLRMLLEEILPQNSNFQDFEVEHDFPHIGRKKMKLDARRLAIKGEKQHLIVLTISDVV